LVGRYLLWGGIDESNGGVYVGKPKRVLESNDQQNAKRILHRRKFYVGCKAAEKSLPWVAQLLGAEHIVFPTGFPRTFTFECSFENTQGGEGFGHF
jgi:hypothetical protein